MSKQDRYEYEWRRLWSPFKFKRWKRSEDIRLTLRDLWKYNLA